MNLFHVPFAFIFHLLVGVFSSFLLFLSTDPGLSFRGSLPGHWGKMGGALAFIASQPLLVRSGPW